MNLRLAYSLCVFIFYCVNCPVIVVRMSSPYFPQLRPNFKFINNSYLYMTTWNLVFTIGYYFVSTAVQIIPFAKEKRKKYYEKLLDHAFITVGLPSTLIVATVFWTFFNYNRELIFPSSIDEHLHPWYNHVMHSTIIVNAVLELVLFHHTMPPRALFFAMDAVILTYITIVHVHYHLTDLWPYFFFFDFTWFHHILLYASCFTLIRISQFIAVKWIRNQQNKKLDLPDEKEETKCK